MRSNRATRGQRLLLGVVVAAALAGATNCGSRPDTATTTTSPPPAAQPPVEPMAVAVRPDGEETRREAGADAADARTVEIARNARLLRADIPEGWSMHARGGARVLTEDSCSHREGGAEAALRPGAAQDGPAHQLGDEHGFITSAAFVFASERDAVEWIETVRADDWARCREAAYERVQDGFDAGVSMELHSRTIRGLGQNGFEAFAEFYGYGPDGNVALVLNVMHYRMGRVVIENTLERGLGLDEQDWVAVDEAHAAAVASAWDRLDAALTNR